METRGPKTRVLPARASWARLSVAQTRVLNVLQEPVLSSSQVTAVQPVSEPSSLHSLYSPHPNLMESALCLVTHTTKHLTEKYIIFKALVNIC